MSPPPAGATDDPTRSSRPRVSRRSGATGEIVQDSVGVEVLLGHPRDDLRVVVGLEPSVRIGYGDAVVFLDRAVAPGVRRWCSGGAQPRPALGLVPWLAGFLRALFLRLAVFFDMGDDAIGPRGR